MSINLQESKIRAHRLLNQHKYIECFLTFMKDLESDPNYIMIADKMSDYGLLMVVNQDYNGMKNWIDGFR